MFGEEFIARIYTWSDKDGKEVAHVGTGYPISSTLLVTARHVIAPKNRKDSKGIRIVWSECKQPAETLSIEDDTDVIVYDGEGKYDLALLHCQTPLTQETAPILSCRFPYAQQSYECCGFPTAGISTGKHDVIFVPGTIIGGRKTEQFRLNTDINVKKEEYWKGLSGAPIFIGRYLYGVVQIKYKTIEKYLYAASIPYLMQHSRVFQRAVAVHQQANSQTLLDQLHKKLIIEIEETLDEGTIPLKKLSKILKLDRSTTSTDMAIHLVKVLSAHQAITALAKLSNNIQARYKQFKRDQWEYYLYDVKQLCGWLLINSIDPVWWSQNEQSVTQPSIDQLANTISLERREYIEVIVSRSLLKQAKYAVNTKGQLLPDKELHNESGHNAGWFDSIVFDAIAEEAFDFEILSGIYKDVRGVGNAPRELKNLLDGIKTTVSSLYEIRDKKMIYYIISQDHLELLQSRTWYADLAQEIGGYLQFICCDVSADTTNKNACNDHQRALLEKVAIIMRLK